MEPSPQTDANTQSLPPAHSPAEVRRRHEANRLAWNQGAAHYSAEVAQTIDLLRAGHSSLHPLERANLGDLRTWCSTAIHLQCASGQDTLSLWVEGARQVVGIDISDVHIANARQTSAALSAPATWYRCDVLDTPHELDGMADLVYTGQGALCWIHDLDAWAKVIHRLLKPGGVFHVLDSHPVMWLFRNDLPDLIASGIDYFRHSETNRGWPDTYIGSLGMPSERHAVKYERQWPMGAVFTALRQAGLEVTRFGEHAEDFWDSWPALKPELRGRLPMTFSMMARKPLHEPEHEVVTP
jgi:SAM-dependent methyltransferase